MAKVTNIDSTAQVKATMFESVAHVVAPFPHARGDDVAPRADELQGGEECSALRENGDGGSA